MSTTKSLLLTWFHSFSCHGFIFALEVLGKSVVYEFHWLIEEMSLDFNLFLPSARSCISPRNIESTKTSHNCISIEKSESWA